MNIHNVCVCIHVYTHIYTHSINIRVCVCMCVYVREVFVCRMRTCERALLLVSRQESINLYPETDNDACGDWDLKRSKKILEVYVFFLF